MWRILLSGLLLLVLSTILPVSTMFAREGITTDRLLLRSSIWGPTMGTFEPGTSIDVYARSWARDGGMWYYVGASDGMSGWMLGNYVYSEPDYQFTIGLQVGHWRREEAPYPFSNSPGASGGGLTEAEMNMITAQSAARHLSARGVRVDILPTVIPKGYKADAVVAIHADGGPESRRGFFVDRPGQSAVADLEARLSQSIVGEYSAAVDIPYVYRSTRNSRYYYGYYDVARSTPMVLIETGFLSNPIDRTILVNQSDNTGAAIAQGVVEFLNGR